MRHAHALPFGAACQADGTTRFRLWAPSAETVTLEIVGATSVPMKRGANGWHSATVHAPPGTRYHYGLPDGLAVPDPASREQAGDVHGPSVVVDPAMFDWPDIGWRGRPWHEAVVYELHAGACGGFHGVTARLPVLHELGATAIELMPIADFPGARNWGYDGVLPFAPASAYGTPDDLKTLVATAHGLGLSVILDVVYNHFGPDGNYLHAYAEPFFRQDEHTPWGAAIDFRRPEVRDFFVQNALYWLMEYRFDGLRFDAVHAISEPDFLAEMAARIRASVEPGRHVHLILEHGGNKASLLSGGFDAQWNDDLHHALHVLLTGESEGYYADFRDAAALLARCLAEGFAYQGQISEHWGRSRGEPSAHLPSTAFVVCLQNHDQIGNRALGERLSVLANPAALAAASALMLLSPFIPMLFMGEEWGTRHPFLYFTSHNAELARLVREGRRKEFAHFAAFADAEQRARIPDPNDPATFTASIPPPDERHRPEHAQVLVRHKQLLALRQHHIVPRIPGCRSEGAAVIGPKAVLARWRMGDGTYLIIASNLDAAPVATAPQGGALIFETDPGTAGALAAGNLPAVSTVALLEPAA